MWERILSAIIISKKNIKGDFADSTIFKCNKTTYKSKKKRKKYNLNIVKCYSHLLYVSK